MSQGIASFMVFFIDIITLVMAYYIGVVSKKSDSIDVSGTVQKITSFNEPTGSKRTMSKNAKIILILTIILVIIDILFWIEYKYHENFKFLYANIISEFYYSQAIWLIMFLMQITAFFFGKRRIHDIQAADLSNIAEDSSITKKHTVSTPILDLLGISFITCLIQSILMFFTIDKIPGLVLVTISIMKFNDIKAGERVWLASLFIGIIYLIITPFMNFNVETTTTLTLSTLGVIFGLGIINKQRNLKNKNNNKAYEYMRENLNLEKSKNSVIETKNVKFFIYDRF